MSEITLYRPVNYRIQVILLGRHLCYTSDEQYYYPQLSLAHVPHTISICKIISRKYFDVCRIVN